jgi:divalent metal cation (Fe/Co/Zn/Cd) transporter
MVPGVLGIEKCWARKNGMSYVVDLHLEIDGDLSVTEGHSISHALKDHLMAVFPYLTDVLIHFCSAHIVAKPILKLIAESI